MYKKNDRAIVEYENIYRSQQVNWDELLKRKGLFGYLKDQIATWEKCEFDITEQLDPPMGNQEIWAAGVTYQRSKEARMEESKDAGGATFYDLVYDAERPELFLKSTLSRTVGHGGVLNIRKDSSWNVPEPELTLLISASGHIEGYTIGNDMSSRSIEGENPLYLPQAKMYERCAGLGPCILIMDNPISRETTITLEIDRQGNQVFKGDIKIDRIKRSFKDLVQYLFRECEFPNGCFLMTGTGIVPPDSFTLKDEDKVSISIEGIGTLENTIGHKL